MQNKSLLLSALFCLTLYGFRANAQSKSAFLPTAMSATAARAHQKANILGTTSVASFPFPSMLQPANKAIDVPVIPKFVIGTISGGYTYYVEVATDSGFSKIISDSWESFYPPTPSDSSIVLYHGIEDPSYYLSGTLYYWRVMVTDSSGQNTSGWSQPYSYTTLSPSAPVGTPTLSSPASYTTISWINVPFTWLAAPGATSYQLQWSNTNFIFSGSYNYRWLDQGQTSDTEQLSPNTTYYWRVIGYNNGSVGQFSGMGTFYTGSQTVLTAPNGTFGIASANYKNGLNLQWLIEPQATKRITLSFSSFSTDSGYDYVTVYDGPTTSSPILGKFTGSKLPQLLMSSSDTMLVRFTTSYSGTGKGWVANYSSTLNQSLVKNAILTQLTIGPSQITYGVPQNSVGYVYFGMTSGGDSVSYAQPFQINLIDQANNVRSVTANLIRPGMLRLCIPVGLIAGNGSTNFSLSDTIPIGGNIYVLNNPAPTFQVSIVSQDCSRTIDFFAEGSAGITGIIGGVAAGASIAAATLSVSGTGGMGFSISIDENNNLTLSRRIDFGLSSSLKIPSVDFVVGQIGPLTLNGSAKAVVSQDISFYGMKNITPDQEQMAQAGFVLETLSLGFSNFSPLVAPLILAINQTLINYQVGQTIDDAIIKTSWGEDFEGGISIGFGGKIGPVKLSLANGSMTGAFSARVNSFPKGLQEAGNEVTSYSFFLQPQTSIFQA